MKPILPQGTRDFKPEILRRRHFIINTIRNLFELYGFEPLETPALENVETLLGKYGDEGDKLIFKILNNGLDHPSKQESARSEFEKVIAGKTVSTITERALRYDLTIPFARFVAMNYHELPMPFKRYQIQPVWRADRPQKGRYREFYQCDADVAGTYSLQADAELALLYRDVFRKLNLPVSVKLNNRKILMALAELTTGAESFRPVTTIIDKLDKIGIEKVKNELINAGLTDEHIQFVEKYLTIQGNIREKINSLKDLFKNSETGLQGLNELETIFNLAGDDPVFDLDTTLARGLDYYTGTIYEVKALNVKMGSIGGGGRYDDLTGLFGVKGVPGTGISFGIDRIYDVMEELNLFTENISESTQLIFFNLGKEESQHAFSLMQECREKGISSELYYDSVKLEKQFKFADKKKIPYAVIIGSREISDGMVKIKELKSGEEQTVKRNDFFSLLEKKYNFKDHS